MKKYSKHINEKDQMYITWKMTDSLLPHVVVAMMTDNFASSPSGSFSRSLTCDCKRLLALNGMPINLSNSSQILNEGSSFYAFGDKLSQPVS